MTDVPALSALEVPADAPPLYAQDGSGYGATVYAHFFVGNADWLLTEYDPADRLAFGWACLGDRANAELGYFQLAELEALEVPLRLEASDGRQIRIGSSRVERDADWPAGLTLQQAVELVDARHGR
jgi:hypothetical protein